MTTFRSYGEAIAATRSALADAGFIHTNGRGWRLSGSNIITPDVVGYYMVAGELVEVSTGPGFSDGRVWGVTFNRANDERPDGRDGCCCSLAELVDVLRRAGEAVTA